MACMDRNAQRQLERGPVPVAGLDAALVFGSDFVADRTDILTAPCVSGMEGTVGVTKASGAMLDVSFASERRRAVAPPAQCQRRRGRTSAPAHFGANMHGCCAWVRAAAPRVPNVPAQPPPMPGRPPIVEGSISVDTARCTSIYGHSEVRTILSSATPAPAELQPLYAALSGIVHQAEPARVSGPARTSASLERFSAGGRGGCVAAMGGGAGGGAAAGGTEGAPAGQMASEPSTVGRASAAVPCMPQATTPITTWS